MTISTPPAVAVTPPPRMNAKLLAPVQPSKIVCVGRNYREHAAELGHDVPPEPLIFLKPPSSLLDPGASIVRPKISQRVDHEGELGVIIGKTCHDFGPDEDVRPGHGAAVRALEEQTKRENWCGSSNRTSLSGRLSRRPRRRHSYSEPRGQELEDQSQQRQRPTAAEFSREAEGDG